MKLIRLFTLTLSIAITACAASKAELISTPRYAGSPINQIGLLPSGVLGDAVLLHLLQMGYSVSPAPAEFSEAEISNSTKRRQIADQGIDALMIVKSTTDKDGRPRSATAFVYSTNTGKLIAGVTWENGHGFGIERSVTNEALRVGHDTAAQQIAQKLALAIPIRKQKTRLRSHTHGSAKAKSNNHQRR